jgi:hypothetical protein
VSRSTIFKSLALAVALLGFAGVNSAKAQDYTDYLHWPYTPPQVPGNGLEYKALYDGFYLYPREQRIVPQIQGPYYENFYGGKLFLGHFRKPFMSHHGLNKTKFYKGYHYTLDVF